MEGTCTGEHGIGIVKKSYLIQELGLDTIGTMKAIKKALDPEWLMNPVSRCAVLSCAVLPCPVLSCPIESTETQRNGDGRSDGSTRFILSLLRFPYGWECGREGWS